jgi:glycosyltransferase involved in cell wall biosynthesis
MRLCFVVQRYGLEVNGGSELACRLLAEHLAREHDIEVLTTRAVDYHTWADHYEYGLTKINDISVRRFSVAKTRDLAAFSRLSLPYKGMEKGRRWVEEQGPYSPDLIDYIVAHADDYDFFIFITFRYYQSFKGLQVVPEKSVLMPTAEEDSALDYAVYKDVFNMPKGIIYLTPEERDIIVAHTGSVDVPGSVIGLGIDEIEPTDKEAFTRSYDIREPYVVYVGRIDTNKGCPHMFDFFLRYKQGREGGLKLYLVGQAFIDVPKHPDIIQLGFISNEDKAAAMKYAAAEIMPSPYESFSFATLEAMAQGTPVLGNAECAVVKGHCIRSNAGLFYGNYPEFAESLDLLAGDAKLSKSLGTNGQKYIEDNYTWDGILVKYQGFLEDLAEHKPAKVIKNSLLDDELKE